MLLSFVIAFIAGPAAFFVLARQSRGRVAVWSLGLMAAGLTISALVLFERAAGQGAQIAALAMLWLAWIAAVTMVVQALRRRLPHMARVLNALGAMATTLPWFGFYFATMVAL